MNQPKSDNSLLTPGMVFEKYTVERLLGKGGMGAVYLVRHNILDSLFALKVLFPEIAVKNARFVDRFIREAKLACKIKHPNLIAVHDAGKNLDTGIYYLVMDYVPGGNVREILKKEKTIPVGRALKIITQIASALAAADQHHMVHRDIKPDNIMFAADGTAKLADLGIAKSTDEQDTMLTMAADVFGTPAYMSPEQAKDSSQVDSRADIYSLGIVFYEMISGQRPIHGKGTIQILSQVVSNEAIPDIRTIMPEIPENIAKLLTDMTEKNVDLRIQSPSELLKRLQQISSAEAGKYRKPQTVELTPLQQIPAGKAEKNIPPAKAAVQQSEYETSVTIENIAARQPDAAEKKPENYPADIELTAVTLAECAEKTVGNIDGNSVETATVAAAAPVASANTQPEVSGNEELPEASNKKRLLRLLIAVAALLLIIILSFAAYARKSQASPATTNAPQPTPQAAPEVISAPAAQATDTPEIAENKIITPGSAVIVSGDPAAYSDMHNTLQPLKLSLIEQDGLGQYAAQIDEIIKAKPIFVIVEISQKFAADDISIATFENVIRFYLSKLRDNLIPFAFCFSTENPEYPKIQKFNAAIAQYCQLYSVPVLEKCQDHSALQKLIEQYAPKTH